MLYKKNLTPEQALQKLRQYCAYQERCHQEVRMKAYTLGVRKAVMETLLARLIEDGLLNEERFAIQFAGGKFRMKQWGKLKIRKELKQREIGEHCIRQALEAIDAEAYENTLMELCLKKWESLTKTDNPYVKHAQAAAYLQQRGFEPDKIQKAIRSIK